MVRAEALRDDRATARLIAEEYERERGPILVEGQPVASIKATDDRLKYLRQYADGALYAPATGFYSLGLRRDRHRAHRELDPGRHRRRLFVRGSSTC